MYRIMEWEIVEDFKESGAGGPVRSMGGRAVLTRLHWFAYPAVQR